MCGKLDEQDLQPIIKLLDQLATTYSDVPRIVAPIARCIVNIIEKQQIQEAQQSAERLGMLATKYSAVPEITIAFANGLANLSGKRPETDNYGEFKLDDPALDSVRYAVNCLECLASKHSEMKKLATFFAYSLYNLALSLDKHGVQQVAARLGHLADEYPDVPEIQIEFAKVLFILMTRYDDLNAQSTMELRQIVNRLKQLVARYPSNLKIVNLFAQSLYLLNCHLPVIPFMDLDINVRRWAIDNLELLATEYPDNTSVAIQFAKSLSDICCTIFMQQKDIDYLEHLAAKYSNIPEVMIAFAKGLVNRCLLHGRAYAQPYRKLYIQQAVNRLEQLVSEYPNIPEIADELIEGRSLLDIQNT